MPWIVVVYKFLKQWQETSGKNVPTNYKEKCELKRLIQSGKSIDRIVIEPKLSLAMNLPIVTTNYPQQLQRKKKTMKRL